MRNLNFPEQSYERKLLSYQKMTGISETKLNEIRSLAKNHSNARKKPKFRYSTNLALPASKNYIQVKFETEELNVNSGWGRRNRGTGRLRIFFATLRYNT